MPVSSSGPWCGLVSSSPRSSGCRSVCGAPPATVKSGAPLRVWREARGRRGREGGQEQRVSTPTSSRAAAGGRGRQASACADGGPSGKPGHPRGDPLPPAGKYIVGLAGAATANIGNGVETTTATAPRLVPRGRWSVCRIRRGLSRAASSFRPLRYRGCRRGHVRGPSPRGGRGDADVVTCGPCPERALSRSGEVRSCRRRHGRSVRRVCPHCKRVQCSR